MSLLSHFTRRDDAEPVEALPEAQRLALIELDNQRGIERQRTIRITRNSPQYRAADTRGRG